MSNFKLNRKGGAEVLKELAAQQINAIAKQIAAQAGPEAEVDEYTTDRAAAAVRVPADQQAKDGALTRAAAAAGLEVRLKQ
ncbi:hypothetical protein [Mycobacteroides abscessus]|uniref:hypothetical protein n=1 Tax=Mycobacteroides abscessus TaxID=36809 RepID=UPI0009A6B4AE|nr:hypothetical protein [Mycobacteroides abscessus]MDB2211829.1 hypothetical protein [Mycobacteroides abscessus subsp. massiliense]MDB2235321.1 hypothetical protein [Mycobacteroides abscessus subsp. massiliense]WJJ56055.1 hypothetical protein PROPHIT362B_32 [Mycobacterium phage prophiT36-2b]SKO29039.1 Uncharacterised protein [Mycobacteroides abscessus subsp. massiliense]